MQIFKLSYVFLFFCFYLFSCTPKNAESSSSEENSSQNTETTTKENLEDKEAKYTFSYKMGTEPLVEEKGNKLSVLLSKKELEDANGQKYYHTALEFQVYYQNRIGLKFVTIDKKVLESINEKYPFTESINFEAGQEQSHMTVMIVDTEGKSQPFASKQTSMAEVNFDGTNLKVSIKGATVTGMQDDEVTIPFEFEIDAKNVKVKKTGF